MKTSNIIITNIFMVENSGWSMDFAKGNDYKNDCNLAFGS